MMVQRKYGIQRKVSLSMKLRVILIILGLVDMVIILSLGVRRKLFIYGKLGFMIVLIRRSRQVLSSYNRFPSKDSLKLKKQADLTQTLHNNLSILNKPSARSVPKTTTSSIYSKNQQNSATHKRT